MFPLRNTMGPLGKSARFKVSWWLSGGVSPANAIVAYQPKGAASLAASYVNLANPGTYNAAPGIAPTWNTTNGWVFVGSSSQYLTTGISPATGWSAVVRFSNIVGTNIALFGSFASGNTYFMILPTATGGGGGIAYYNGSFIVQPPTTTSGVLAIAGTQGYRNGVPDGGTIGAWSGMGANISIGAWNNNGVNSLYLTGHIQAIAIYNTILSADQVATITSAMQAL